MEYVLKAPKRVADNHQIIFFHNDTRIFGDWIGTQVISKEKLPITSSTDPMHLFFRDIIFGTEQTPGSGSDSSGTPSRLRLGYSQDARLDLDIQVAGVWYQKLQLELGNTSQWYGQDGNHVVCKTYWKLRKLVVLIYDKNQFISEDFSDRMLVINVMHDDPSQLILSLKWTSDFIYRKVYKRVTFKEILLVDKIAQRSGLIESE